MTNPEPAPPGDEVSNVAYPMPRLGKGVCWSDIAREIESGTPAEPYYRPRSAGVLDGH